MAWVVLPPRPALGPSSRRGFRARTRCGLVSLLTLLGGATSVSAQAPDPDLNNDGVVNILDVSMVSRCLGREVPTRPVLAILVPADQSVLSSTPISVSGTVNDGIASLEVNGLAATVSGGAFVADGVPLQEGVNLLAATATTVSDPCVPADTDADGKVDPNDLRFVTASFGQSGFPLGELPPDFLTGTSSIQVTLETADTQPPAVTLSAPAQVTVGSLLVLSATATDASGVASVSFLLNGVLLATDTEAPYQAQLPLPPGTLPGAIVRVEARAVDVLGLEASDFADVRVIAPALPGAGVIAGRVYDDTSGLALGDATIRLLALEGEPTGATMSPVASDRRGRFRLAADPGTARILVSKNGFTESERMVEVVSGRRSDPFDARLTPLDSGRSVSSVLGGKVSSSSGGIELVLPAGALAADQTMHLIPLGPQGLIGRLPLGWSPVVAVDVSPGNLSFALQATLSMPVPSELAPGMPLLVARWEPGAAWIALGFANRTADGKRFELGLTRSGQYAFLLPDAPPDGPPPPTVGQAIPGLLPNPPPENLTVEISPSPRILLARTDVLTQSRVGVLVKPPSPIPSGTPFQTELDESFSFFAGRSLYPDPAAQHFALYAFPPAGLPNLQSSFTVTPSRVFDSRELELGIIDLAVRLPIDPGAPRGTVVGPDGGFAEAATGQRLSVPAGATGESLPVVLSELALEDFPISIPLGVSFLSAVTLDFHGGALELPAGLSQPVPPGLTPGAQLLVVQLVEVDSASTLALVGLGLVEGGDLLVATDPRGDGSLLFPGVRAEGRVAFLEASTPFGFVTGTVRGDDGLPRSGALVSVDSLDVVSLTDGLGRYVLAAPIGEVQVTAVDPVTGDVVTASATIVSPDEVAHLDQEVSATPPFVVSVSPLNGAQNVALSAAVTVRFSEPIDPKSLIPDPVMLSDGTTPVAGKISLAAGNTTLSFRPSQLLVSQTTYLVSVSGAIRDLSGNPMGAPFVSGFTTVDQTPPRPPLPGTVTATIPDATGRTTVSGSQGTAEPGGIVVVKNLTTGTLTTVAPNPDGSFTAVVAASTADKLQLILRDTAGNETAVPIGPFRNPDGSVVVGLEGGRVEGAGGVFVDVPPGALPAGTVVRVEPVQEHELGLAVPTGFPFAGGLRLDLGGVKPKSTLDVGFPAPPGATPEDQALVIQAIQLPRRRAWTVVDRAHLEGDRYVTASFPFPGVIAEGTFVLAEVQLFRIKPGPNGVLDSLPVQGDDIVQAVSGVPTIRGGENLKLDTFVEPDDVPEKDCLSYVTVNWQFSLNVTVTPSGIPFAYPATTSSLATIPALCESQLQIQIIEPNTEQVIAQITQVAPAVADEIFFYPSTVTDNTTPPRVLWSNVPTLGKVEQVRILFSKAMDPGSLSEHFRLENLGVQVPGTVLLSNTETLAVFVPSTPFLYGELYRVILDGAKDRSGNKIQAEPIQFRTFGPIPVAELDDEPELKHLLEKCAGATCTTSVRDVAFLGNTLFLANGLQAQNEQYEDPTNPTRLIALDMAYPSVPRLIGSHRTFTNPKALAVFEHASFTLPEGGPFTGDLLVVVGGGRVPGGDLPGRLEIYDVTRCVRGPVAENCLDQQLNPLRGVKVLTATPGVPPAPGVPGTWGIPLQVATLHQVGVGGSDDTALAYVVTAGLGLEGVDVTKAFNVPLTPSSKIAPDALVLGDLDFLDVAVLKNRVLAIEHRPDGSVNLEVLSAQLGRDFPVFLALPAARLATLANLPIDVDGDGNLGLAENNDSDPISARDELFDFAVIGSGPISDQNTCNELFTTDDGFTAPAPLPCGALYVIDLSSKTDLAHKPLPDPVVAIVPLPGPAFGVRVDPKKLLAYVEVRGHGLSVIDLSARDLTDLAGIGLEDRLPDFGRDDRVLFTFKNSGIFSGDVDVDLDRGLAYINDSVNGIRVICIDSLNCSRPAPSAPPPLPQPPPTKILRLVLESGALDSQSPFPSSDGETAELVVTPEIWQSSTKVCARLNVEIPPDHSISYTISEHPQFAPMLDLSNGNSGVVDPLDPRVCVTTKPKEGFPLHSYAVLELFDGAPSTPVQKVREFLLHLTPAMVLADDLRLTTRIDRINGLTCAGGGELAFTLTWNAQVTVTIDGSAVESAVARVAGDHRIPITPNMVSAPGPHVFQIQAVFSTPGPQLTTSVVGNIAHDVEINGSFPIGHTMLKGVDIWDGHVTHQSTDVAIAGRGLSLELTRTYSSAGNSSQGTLGAGWTHNYNVRLIKDGCERFVVIGSEGTGNSFTFDGTSFQPQIGYHSRLTRNPLDSSQFDFFTKANVRYHLEREPGFPGEVYTLRFIEEPNGNRITLDYFSGDADGTTLDVIRDSSGRSLALEYAAPGSPDEVLFRGQRRIVRISGRNEGSGSDLLGLEIVYEYDDHLNLKSVTRKSPNPSANLNDERVELYSYTDNVLDLHNLTSYTDPNGHTTTYLYHNPTDAIPGVDAFGVERHEIIKTVVEPEEVVSRFAYDFAAGKRKVTDPRSEDSQEPAPPPPTTYTLNHYGATVQIDAPLGKTTVMEWCTEAPSAACPDKEGNPGLDVLMTKMVDAEGRTYLYEYGDGLGNLTRETIQFTGNKAPVTLSDGTTPVAQITTVRDYEPTFSNVTRETDPEGNSTLYLIDAPYTGKPDFCLDSTPGRDTGNLIGTKDAEENVTCYTYADNGDRLTVTDPRQFETAYTAYDDFGNPEKIKDPEGNVTTNVFDERSRLIETSDTFTHHTRYEYDGLDRQIFEARLDDLGGQGTDQETIYRYRPKGQLETLTDGLGQLTRYVYDDLDRLIEEREEGVLQADGTEIVLRTTYEYDRGSNVIRETDPREVHFVHRYDELNRRDQTRVEGPFAPNEIILSNDFDLMNNKLSETDLHGHRTEYIYDGLYRLVETRLPHQHPFGDVPSANAAVTKTAYDRAGTKVLQTDRNGRPARYLYDHIYRLVRATDADGNVTTYAYDPAGNKIREENLTTGLVSEWTNPDHDGLNRPKVMRQTVPLGGPALTTAVYETFYDYEDDDNSAVITNPRGFKARAHKDGLDRPIETIVDQDGLQLTTRQTYDGNGNLITLQDAEGGDIDVTHEYDGLNRKIRSSYVDTPSDTTPVTEEFVYDGNGNLIEYKDRRGIVFLNDYDNLNRELTKRVRETITNNGAELTMTSSVYDDPGSSITATDANQNQTTTFLDGFHRPRIVDDPDQNGPFDPTGSGPFPSGLTVYEYDGVNLRRQFDKKGHRTEFDYDEINRVIDTRELDLTGTLRTTLHVEYLDAENRVRETDRRGTVTTRRMDGLERLVQLRRSGLDMAVHYGSDEVLLESYEYDGNGNKTAFVDGGQNRTEYVYDAADRPTILKEGVGSPVEATTLTTYDDVGNILTVKDGRDHGGEFDVKYEYDARYRKVQATNGELETSKYAYDANNNAVRSTEPNGEAFSTEYRFDELNALLSVDETPRADGTTNAGVTRFFYDGNRNQIAQQDANGNLVTSKYDDLNRLVDTFQHTVAGALDDGTSRGSDSRGTEFYDSFAGGDEASALRWHYGYDLNGNQNLIVDAKAQRVGMTHDYRDRLVTKTYQAHSDPQLDFQMKSIEYLYDGNGNVESIQEIKTLGGLDITEHRDSSYDPLDREQTSLHRDYDDATGKRIEYDYDVQGNTSRILDPDGIETTYLYDARNRLETASTEAGVTKYSYWEDNLIRRTEYLSGTASATVRDQSEPDAYDRADRPLRITNRPADESLPIFSDYEYTYDDNGNRLTQTETQSALNGAIPESTAYEYDQLNRLLTVSYGAGGAAGHLTYSYDPNGNRRTENGTDPHTGEPVDRSYVYDQLPGRSETTFDRVNVLSRITDNLFPDRTVTYEYDRNLNQAAKERGGSRTEYRFGIRDQILAADGLSGATVRFDYDHSGMRAKKIDAATNMETRYLYDEDSVLLEYTGSSAAFKTFHKYDYGYELLSLTRVDIFSQNRSSQFYLTDALMSTSNLTDESGALAQSYRYDAWGRLRDESGASTNPREYTGQYTDRETGLHYFGARYYDDETGRFVSQDPYLGSPSNAPSLHRYLYAYGNPLRFTDVSGYAPVEASGAQSVGGVGGAAEGAPARPLLRVIREDSVPEERSTRYWAATAGTWDEINADSTRRLRFLLNQSIAESREQSADDSLEPTGAWAGDIARWTERNQRYTEDALGGWVGEGGGWMKSAIAAAAQTPVDALAMLADPLKLGEGAARGGWGWAEDAFRAVDIATTLAGAPRGVSTLKGSLTRGVKKSLLAFAPRSGASPRELWAWKKVLGDDLMVGVRALDAGSAWGTKRAAERGVLPKPIWIKDKSGLSGIVKKDGLVWRSDQDIAYFRERRSGKFLNKERVQEKIAEYNKLVPPEYQLQHNAQFNAWTGGDVSLEKYGGIGRPGPVVEYRVSKSKLAMRTMTDSQVELLSRMHPTELPWHPKWNQGRNPWAQVGLDAAAGGLLLTPKSSFVYQRLTEK